jgi:outer membrane receptor for Fe3+-dicitrate
MIAGFDIVFLRWRELGKLTGHVDESIVNETIAGCDIVVTGPTLPVFPSQRVTATFTVQDLERLSTGSGFAHDSTIFETSGLGPEFLAGHRFMDKAQNLKQDELKLHRTSVGRSKPSSRTRSSYRGESSAIWWATWTSPSSTR